MIHKATRYTPRAVIKFSMGELRLMLKCSEHHYDARCKEASAEHISYEGNRPGFLRGMYNCRKNAGTRWEHVLTFSELDTLAKILEQGHFHVDTEVGKGRLAGLQFGIRRVLQSLNDMSLDDIPIKKP